MAPPIDDLSPKTVKVVVGGARKHSDNEAESLADALSSTTNILTSDLFEVHQGFGLGGGGLGEPGESRKVQ